MNFLKNEMLFFLAIEIFGTPASLYFNHEEAIFEQSQISYALVGHTQEHIALWYGKDFQIIICDGTLDFTIKTNLQGANEKFFELLTKTQKMQSRLLQFYTFVQTIPN